MSTIITNARLVLEGEVVRGSVELGDRLIRSVDQGASGVSQAIDAEGDFLAPGLIEMHTDNLERHFMPRPGVVWPNALAAALAHDGQMAAAGVTTVYDAICVGYERDNTMSRADIFNGLVAAIGEGVRQDVFRIEHRLHLRCELTGGELVRTVAPHLENPLLCLASLMDHTPGQRQWRELASHKRYTMGTTGMSEAEFDAHVAKRIAEGGTNAERNRPIMLDMLRSRGIPLATHDDTTEEHVRSATALGVVISEFPTTLVAATTAKALGLATIAGAPNLVCGGSHSEGVTVGELAEKGVLDGLSSDYVPASLLKGVGGLDMAGPHISRFSMVMRRMRVRSSGAIERRPGLPVRPERRRQYVRQPRRCHRSTVSGFTMRREVRQPLNQRHTKIQKRRSASSRRGRGLRRCRTSSCCRRQRLSAISSAFGRTAAAIAHSKQRNIASPRVVGPPGG